MKTWEDLRPGLEAAFDGVNAATSFGNIPDYHAAYASLTKKVEQSDFFRYLVVTNTEGCARTWTRSVARPIDGVS